MAKIKFEIVQTPKQKAFDRAIEKYENVLYGGAKGGGKSHGLREIILKLALQYAGSTSCILRKTYPELYENHVQPLLNRFPVLRKWYSTKHNEINLPNGSIIKFRYCQYARDLEIHQGQEYHFLGIEEAGQWPEHWFWALKTCNRSSAPHIKPRCLLTCNPGGIGHKWLKRLFISRQFKPAEQPESFHFIQAKVHDNPALMKVDPGYVRRLEALPNAMLRRAYLEGDWDISAGQYFDIFNRDMHVVQPFNLPDHWRRFAAYDHGYKHPAAFQWFACDEDGQVYLYREYLRNLRSIKEITDDLLATEDIDSLGYITAGPDCWAKRGGPTVKEEFYNLSRGKINFIQAKTDRIAGANQVRNYLSYGKPDNGGGPRLQIFSTCPKTIETLANLVHDEKNPEDVLKIDASIDDPESGDDLYDCLRYGLMSRPQASDRIITPEEKRRERDKYDQERDVLTWQTV